MGAAPAAVVGALDSDRSVHPLLRGVVGGRTEALFFRIKIEVGHGSE